MPYGLIVNGSLVSLLDDVKYLLSPQDLCAIDLVPQLITAGVKSFKIEVPLFTCRLLKPALHNLLTIHPLLLPTLILPTVTIQGRLKGPEYVAITTKTYRLAVDDAWTKLLASQPLEIEQPLAIESSSLPPTQTQTQTPQVAGTIASKIKSKISVKTTAAAVVSPSTLSPLDEQLQQDLRQVFARGQDADHDGLSRCVHRCHYHQETHPAPIKHFCPFISTNLSLLTRFSCFRSP